MGKAFMAFLPGIIVNFFTVLIEFGLFAAAIFKTVQVDLYTKRMERLYFVKQVEHSPIINRIRCIQANNM